MISTLKKIGRLSNYDTGVLDRIAATACKPHKRLRTAAQPLFKRPKVLDWWNKRWIQETVDALLRHGRRVADPLWQLPLWPGYDEDIASKVADVNNASAATFAGTSS